MLLSTETFPEATLKIWENILELVRHFVTDDILKGFGDNRRDTACPLGIFLCPSFSLKTSYIMTNLKEFANSDELIAPLK